MSDAFAGTPVLLWQMGKVGSTSIWQALEEANLRPIQLHVLDPDRIDHVAQQYQGGGYSVPAHIEDARRVQSLIADPDQRLRVISLVRDPIARNLSGLFETWDVYPPDFREGDDLEKLAEWFVMNFDYSILNWFDDEIRARTGVDVYSAKFDMEKRRLLIETSRLKILVLRSEDSQRSKEASLKEFLHLPKVSLTYSNTSDSKPNPALWKSMKRSAKVSSILANIVYDSKLVRHFYAEDEVSRFRALWTPSRDGTYFEPPRGEKASDQR
jgi:hypothetical protein